MNNYLITDNLTDAKAFVAEAIGTAYHLHFAGTQGTIACWEVVAGGKIDQAGKVYEYADGAVVVALFT